MLCEEPTAPLLTRVRHLGGASQCSLWDFTCTSSHGMVGSDLGMGVLRDMLLMGVLHHSPLPPASQSNQEQSLQQKLLNEQFGVLQETVREAQAILRDAMAKLDDPLHLRCTSSPGTSCSCRRLKHAVPSPSWTDNVVSQLSSGFFSIMPEVVRVRLPRTNF